jgi:hypothetical protein
MILTLLASLLAFSADLHGGGVIPEDVRGLLTPDGGLWVFYDLWSASADPMGKHGMAKSSR